MGYEAELTRVVEPNDVRRLRIAMNPLGPRGVEPTEGVRHRTDTPIATGAAFVHPVRSDPATACGSARLGLLRSKFL